MARYDAVKERYSKIQILGKQALFTPMRLERNTVPVGFYLYEVRHDDDGIGDPVQIARGILVNHWGTILTTEPIDIPEDGYLDIDPEKDWDYLDEDSCLLKDFMKRSVELLEENSTGKEGHESTRV